MLGYVTPEKSELRLREHEVYSAYYCGLCRIAGRNHGQLPRLFLNFDFVFLAMLLSALDPEPDELREFRCHVHPARKKYSVVSSAVLDYSVGMMLLLSYHKSIDDKNDEKSFKAGVCAAILRSSYRKICGRMRMKSERIKTYIDQISIMEKQNCASLDTVMEPFALLMEEVFDFEGIGHTAQSDSHKEGIRYALRRIGHYIGKWIYLIDAYDDLESDVKTGAYNPLVLNYGFNAGGYEGEGIERFKERINDRVGLNATLYLSDISGTLALLPIKKNLAILENIVYIGLRKRTEDILGKRIDCLSSYKDSLNE
jgi:hypothetical protein